MFTGIVEELGAIQSAHRHGNVWRLGIKAAKVCEGMVVGDSVAVDGVCLTVVGARPDGFDAEISPETRYLSTLENAAPGKEVNLERALTLNTRLGGHIVQGHVDARGMIISLTRGESAWELVVRAPAGGWKYIAEKGSVAVDGVSLTVAAIEGDAFRVAAIPHTIERTTLHEKKSGDEVNLEYDVVAKYVESLLERKKNDADLLSEEFLKERG